MLVFCALLLMFTSQSLDHEIEALKLITSTALCHLYSGIFLHRSVIACSNLTMNSLESNLRASALGVPGYALVTGGASGIGRAIVRLLAREACSGIAVADINADALMAVQKELIEIATNKTFKCITINVDVRDESSVTNMVRQATEHFGRIDYAVNCAGIGLKKPLADTDLKEWDRMMGINMTGVFLCMKAEINQMITQDPPTSSG